MLNMLLRKERIRHGILQANVSIHRGFGRSNLQVSGGAIDVEGARLIKESMVKPTLSDGFCVRAFNCYPLDIKTEEILKELFFLYVNELEVKDMKSGDDDHLRLFQCIFATPRQEKDVERLDIDPRFLDARTANVINEWATMVQVDNLTISANLGGYDVTQELFDVFRVVFAANVKKPRKLDVYCAGENRTNFEFLSSSTDLKEVFLDHCHAIENLSQMQQVRSKHGYIIFSCHVVVLHLHCTSFTDSQAHHGWRRMPHEDRACRPCQSPKVPAHLS